MDGYQRKNELQKLSRQKSVYKYVELLFLKYCEASMYATKNKRNYENDK